MSLNFPGTRKQRELACIACQLCCKLLCVPTGFPPEEHEWASEYFKFRGDTTAIVHGILVVVVNRPCQHLTVFGCKAYHERPTICREGSGLSDPVLRDRCAWRLINAEPVTKSFDIEDLFA